MRVGFFVTCLVDLMRPSIGFAAIEAARSRAAPKSTCRRTRRAAASPPTTPATARTRSRSRARSSREFEGCDYLVAPSGSCSGMIRTHYPDLFADDPAMLARVQALAARTYELTDFLVNVLKLERVPGSLPARSPITIAAPACARWASRTQPRALLAKVAGPHAARDGRVRDVLRLRRHVLDQVRRDLDAAGRQQVPATSRTRAPMPWCWATSGCMLNIEGRLRRRGDTTTKVLHIAEVLAGETSVQFLEPRRTRRTRRKAEGRTGSQACSGLSSCSSCPSWLRICLEA